MTYWIAALLLTVFGFVGGFSIGGPFLIVGLAMLILGPVRRWPRVFWPALVGLIAFVVTSVLVAPISCTATSETGGVSHTSCWSILGPTWSGSGDYNPPPEAFALAFRDGLAAAVVLAAASFVWLTVLRRQDRRPSRSPGGGPGDISAH